MTLGVFIPGNACEPRSSCLANLNLSPLFAELNALVPAGRSQDFAVTTPSWGRMDTPPPRPSSSLLSAEEAKDRLREIVEGFFFRKLRTEDGKRVGRLLLKSPPGLGKTTQAVEFAIRYQAERAGKDGTRVLVYDFNEAGIPAQTSIFVPRHQLAEELRRAIECAFRERGEPITVPILRGRENGGEEGRAPCRRWREAHALARKGLPIYTNLCQSRANGQSAQCPHFAGCEYIQTRQSAYTSPFVILVHSHLGLEWGATAAERFHEDEDEDGDGAEERQQHFNPRQANIIICDEDPTTSLVEADKLSAEDIRGLGEDGLGEKVLEGLVHPSGLLTYLRNHGISADQLLAAAGEARTAERSRGQISTSPDTGDGDVAQAAQSARRLVRVSRVLDRLADDLASGRPGPAYSLLAEGEGLIAQGRRPWVFDDQRLLLLDGTANPEILRQFVPRLRDLPEIRVRRKARVIQTSNMTFYKGRLIKRADGFGGKGAAKPTALLLEVADFIEKIARKGKTLVVTNKPVRCALTGENEHGTLPVSAQYRGADIAHFGNLRGSNAFEGHEIAIILGRDEPSVAAAEQRAMAIWYDTKEPIRRLSRDIRGHINYRKRTRCYLMRDGRNKHGSVSIHPDPRVQAVVEQGREAEMIQAIDRLRLIHSERPKTVYILCSIPLDIPVDELVTWKQLIGDRRLSDSLAQCDERGWDALPLAPKELTRLFPELWRTRKAAEDWARKNPLNPSLSSIRLWGVLNTYRPPGQTSWSKALVRHEADARGALAGVLRVPAGDIRVRERPD